MTVRKRIWHNEDGSVSQAWEVDIHFRHPDGSTQRIRRLSPGNTERDAVMYEHQLIASLVTGTFDTVQADDLPTVEQFSEEWFTGYVMVENKPTVIRTTKSALKSRINPFFGQMRIDRVNQREIAKFKGWCQNEGLSPKTINNLLGILSKMLRTAVDWEVMEQSPKIKKMKNRIPEMDFFDFDETDRLLDAVKDEHYAIVFTALKTGMRLGELCALRWQDVDLVKGQIRVCQAATRGVVSTPKSGKTRTIPMPTDLVSVLKAHKPKTFMKSEYVFCTDDGDILTGNRLKRVLPHACKKAGLRDIQWHGLRHTYASHLVMCGVSLKVIQELLGHATIDVTMRYAHLAPDVKHDAVQLLNGTNTEQKKPRHLNMLK